MNHFRVIQLLLLISLIGVSCSGPQPEKMTKTAEKSNAEVKPMEAGFQLLDNSCLSCHSPSNHSGNRIAPTFAAIKKAYLKKGKSLEQFTADLNTFLSNPSEANSQMPDALKLYSLMPKMNVSTENSSLMAAFLYSTDLENPNWYEEMKGKTNSNSNFNVSPLEKGMELALKTKAVLGKNLMQAIQAGGTENALTFCSSKAIPLTDSMSLALNASIKRVSDKNRNPKNNANKTELSVLSKMKKQLALGEKPTPTLLKEGAVSRGYYPILTDKMCLQCHGVPRTEVLPKTLTAIQAYYPNDKATGFRLNELRGIWVVEMKE